MPSVSPAYHDEGYYVPTGEIAGMELASRSNARGARKATNLTKRERTDVFLRESPPKKSEKTPVSMQPSCAVALICPTSAG
eukprot:6061857-Heterocapsa_arctica.AAC.1